ncbi:hypothetical protein FF38_07953 [Lucilia cuprina]|uniref:Uncharacterized protein n=1 Tax=Lucilia cuprina TaxID=7375 RepID=A0A0L0CNF7_LUCCU|nr:hypothetical protein FF38_07953 [Lucilia cuprina]
MEVEDQGSKGATVADPAPATIPDPVPAPTPSTTPSPTPSLTPTLVSDSASELLALKVASVEKSSESTDPDPGVGAPAKASNVESPGSNVCKQCRGRHPLYRHLANECKSLVKCNICHDNHHSLLHSPGKDQKKKGAKPKPPTSAQSKAKSMPYPVQTSHVPLRHSINLSPTSKARWAQRIL